MFIIIAQFFCFFVPMPTLEDYDSPNQPGMNAKADLGYHYPHMLVSSGDFLASLLNSRQHEFNLDYIYP